MLDSCLFHRIMFYVYLPTLHLSPNLGADLNQNNWANWGRVLFFFYFKVHFCMFAILTCKTLAKHAELMGAN